MSRSDWYRGSLCVAVTGAAIGLAYLARFSLIEPAHMEPQCLLAAAHWQCVVRQGIIAAFAHNGLGLAATLLALLAMFSRSFAVTLLALAAAGAGLALYCASWCAPALWLAGLAAVRARPVPHACTQQHQ
jgi:hypothetical protein